MKRIMMIAMVVLMIALLVIAPVSAMKNKLNLKGVVVEIDETSLTVQSKKGDSIVFSFPDGMDSHDFQIGDSVLVKAISGEGGTWVIESIKKVGAAGGGDGNQERAEGFKDNSAFCAEGKQEKVHPLASKIAERYVVAEETVMDYFCEGYSMGAIMLAIKTSQLDGVSISPGDLLADREAGKGWGQIWKELGLIGSEKDGHSPPGLLKKPNHADP